MIYAIIILLALAIAFIILVRRLPQAVNAAKTEPVSLPPLARPAAAPAPTSKPNFKMPVPNFTPLAQGFSRLAGGLKNIKLPSLPKRAPKTAASIGSAPSNNTATSREDFWQEKVKATDTSKPASEPTVESKTELTPVEPIAAPLPAQPKPEPISMPDEPAVKMKGRNLPQEAEDAFAIKDYKKAERLYLRLATEDPKNARVYSRLGVIYLEQKTYEDARDALQAAIKLEPQAASRHFNLALCYIQLGSKAKAISAMEMALKHDPSNRKYRKMLDDLMGGRI
jgi:hypothetical protein